MPTATTIPDWPAADALLCAIRAADNAVAKLTARRKEAIRKIDAHYGPQIDDLVEARVPMVGDLEAFCTAHRADFGKAKSRQLDNGKVGWKAEPPKLALLTEAKSWATVLAKVLDAGKAFAHWIRRKPCLAKDIALADAKAGKVSADTLKALDLKLAGGDDKFFATPKADPIRDRADDA
jgi:phage host-nuclease inhibitor protein Gam